MKYNGRKAHYGIAAALAAGIAIAMVPSANAQNTDSGYKVGEQTKDAPATPPTATPPAATVPRFARIDYVSGNVTWRRNETDAWAPAKTNIPLVEGAQIWATEGGRAEIRFDDGSILRLGGGAVVTVQTLYGDDKGEFNEFKLSSGLATLRPRHARTVFQMNTAVLAVRSAGPSRVRVGAADDAEVAVKFGQAVVEGDGGKKTLVAGDYLAAREGDTAYKLRNLPKEDAWERWNDDRDDVLARSEYSHHGGSYPGPTYVAPGPAVGIGVGIDIFSGPGWGGHGWGRGYHWH